MRLSFFGRALLSLLLSVLLILVLLFVLLLLILVLLLILILLLVLLLILILTHFIIVLSFFGYGIYHTHSFFPSGVGLFIFLFVNKIHNSVEHLRRLRSGQFVIGTDSSARGAHNSKLAHGVN